MAEVSPAECLLEVLWFVSALRFTLTLNLGQRDDQKFGVIVLVLIQNDMFDNIMAFICLFVSSSPQGSLISGIRTSQILRLRMQQISACRRSKFGKECRVSDLHCEKTHISCLFTIYMICLQPSL
jgi:hypothetical protein